MEKQSVFVKMVDERKELYLIAYHLKSGMPAEVLIPAPEWTTRYSDSLINWASVSTFAFSSSGLSNTCHRRENIRFKNNRPVQFVPVKNDNNLNIKSIWKWLRIEKGRFHTTRGEWNVWEKYKSNVCMMVMQEERCLFHIAWTTRATTTTKKTVMQLVNKEKKMFTMFKHQILNLMLQF